MTRSATSEARFPGERTGMGLLARLAEYAVQHPDSPALRTSNPDGGPDRVTTYADLHARVLACGAELRHRFPGSATIAIACPTNVEFAAAYLGILHAGHIVHPIPQNSSAAEIRAFLSATAAVAMIGDPEALATAAGCGIPLILSDSLPHRMRGPVVPQRSPDPLAPGLYLPSSGTTGLPKIAVRSRGSLDAVAANVALAAGLRREDSVLAAVPMSHSYGMENGLLGPIWAGSCIHIVDRRNAGPGVRPDVGELLGELRRGSVSVLPAVPFMVDVLAKLAPESRVQTGLRLVYTAGSPLPESVAALFQERFGLGVGQLYGATEVGSVTFAPPGASEDRLAVGAAFPGVSILILDSESPNLERPLAAGNEGQVAIRAESMLSHYLGGDRSDPAFLGDYFLTGDLGRLGADGALTITGRLKLLIDVGGFKVNPLEVERTIAAHPSIGEVVVLPVRVTETVSRLRAVVTAAAGDVPVEEVRAFARERLAAHKVPRSIEVVERLPKSPTGKVLRRELEGGS